MPCSGLLLMAAQPVPAPDKPAIPVARTATRTVQQIFDDAAAATDRRDYPSALADYETIERRLGAKGSVASLAIVRARKGALLFQMGQPDDAAELLRYAVARLPRDTNLGGDRYLSAWLLGRIEEKALDYSAARRNYLLAEADAIETADKIAIWASLARVSMFDDPPGAVRLADKALAGATADTTIAKPAIAQYRTLRGRALLNAGDLAAAQAELGQAMRDLGGLASRVDFADIAARSDLAIAAMLGGDTESARKYLA